MQASFPDKIQLGTEADGVQAGLIDEAERALEVRLPEEFRAFLSRFGWATLGGLEIYSIYQSPFSDHIDTSDFVYMNKVNQRIGVVPRHYLEFASHDGSDAFYLNSSLYDQNEHQVSEVAILDQDLGEMVRAASDLVSFFRMAIEGAYGHQE